MEELDNSFSNYKTWLVEDYNVFMYNHSDPTNLGCGIDSKWGGYWINSDLILNEILEKPEFKSISSAINSIIEEFKYISEDIQGHPYFTNEHRSTNGYYRCDTLSPFQLMTEVVDKSFLKVSFVSAVKFNEGLPYYVPFERVFTSSDCPETIEKTVKEILVFMYDYINKSLSMKEEEIVEDEEEEEEC